MCIFCCLVILYVDLVFYEFFCWPVKLSSHHTAACPELNKIRIGSLACSVAASVPAMHLSWIVVLLVTGDGLLSSVAAQSQSGR